MKDQIFNEKLKKSIRPIIYIGISLYSFKMEGSSKIGTQEFRKKLIRNGENLAMKDIDHKIPKNLGGVDHTWNYQVISSSENRSWQDGHLIDKFLKNPIGMVGGIFISFVFPIMRIVPLLVGISEFSEKTGSIIKGLDSINKIIGFGLMIIFGLVVIGIIIIIGIIWMIIAR